MTKWGSGKETADYVVNHGKLLQVGDTWLGHEKTLTVVYRYDGGPTFVATACSRSSIA